jgi:hypothetical protein
VNVSSCWTVSLCCSAAEAKAAAISMGLTAPALHPTDLAGRQAAAEKLLGAMLNGGKAGGLRAACAEGFGMLISGIAAGIPEQVGLHTADE